jgi:predicted amidohydrolase
MADSGSTIRVVALSAGLDHFKDGNPGAEANFAHLMTLAEACISGKPDIIVFPEFAMIGWPYLSAEDVTKLAEPVPGGECYYRQYVELAKKSGAVVCGWIAEKESDDVLHNSSCLIGPDGNLIGTYRKTHPTASEEGAWSMAPGTEIPVFDLGFVKVGIAICWDMHFPEVCRALLVQGADMILHPTIGNDRRDVCPVRCKENGLPMVVSIFKEASYAIDVRGNVIADLGDSNGGTLVCDIDPHTHRSSKYGYDFRERDMTRARRNPEAYKTLVDTTTRVPWTEVFAGKEGEPISEQDLLEKFPKLKNLT